MANTHTAMIASAWMMTTSKTKCTKRSGHLRKLNSLCDVRCLILSKRRSEERNQHIDAHFAFAASLWEQSLFWSHSTDMLTQIDWYQMRFKSNTAIQTQSAIVKWSDVSIHGGRINEGNVKKKM